MSKTRNPVHCPVPDCRWTVPPNTHKPHAAMKQHIITEHSDTHPSDYMTPKYCHQHGFHLCRQCDTPTAIFNTQGHLRQHITKKHSRSQTNIQLVLNTYRHLTTETENNWKQSLAFLHRLDPTPPPFRRTIWHKVKPPLRAEYYTVYNNVANWVIEATPPLAPAILKDDQPAQHDTDSTPFWKLLTILEPLLLAPTKNTVHLTHSNAFRARLAMLKQGRLQELYDVVWNPPPVPKLKGRQKEHKKKQQQRQQRHPNPPTDNSLQPWQLRAAQETANLGNYRAALKILTTNTPTATLTPPRIQRCKAELFPNRRQPPPTTRSQGQEPNMPPPAAQFLQLEDGPFELALRQMKPGTASGPFANCTDTIVSMALHRTTRAPDSTRPYFGTIKALMQLVVTAQVPPPIQTILASNYFLALHKDLNNLEKLRPIGIGTAIRRVAAKTALVHLTEDIKPILLKGGQYGIQIPGGVDFVAQTTAMAVRRFIDRNQNTNNNNQPIEQDPNPPSRALLLLDLTNMFNNVSRTEARKILLSDEATTPLVPLFDLLTNHPCNSWYFDENKQARYLLQEEGFPQGCPLSPLFSCIVLLALTTRLNKEQAQRALERKRNGDPHDDGKGGIAHTASIMDDTSICLPHCDLPWFLTRFKELGEPLGIILNHEKTKILSSTSHSSPMKTLSPDNQAYLQEALSFLSASNPPSAEITSGVRFLGQPIGSSTFAKQYIEGKLHKLENNLNKLHQLDNLQTRNALFKFSMVASLLHLLPSDITLAHPKKNPRSTLWKSPTTDKTEEIIRHFLAKLSGIPEDNVPTPSALIASLPQRLGGLGYQHAAAAAYPRLMTQTARAISMAGSTETPIPDVHRQPFSNWEENPSPELTNFRKALSLFANELAEEALYVPSRYDTETHNRLMHHTLREHVVPRIFTDTPPEQRIFLPSVLSPLTSMAFTLPLTASQFRIENSVFKTALKRKLRLPLFLPQQHQHIPLRCRCSSNKRLDPTGDHLYSCSAASKTPLSNAIRDTLFDVLKQVAPAARTVESVHDVHVEPPGLAPGHHRNIRPADVGLLLRQPHKNRHFQYLALDITIPPPQQPQAILDPSDHEKIAESASRTHQDAAREKFCRDPTTAQHLLQNGVYLLPFTVDHLGSLGSFADNFLFPFSHHPYNFSTAQPPAWDNPNFGKDTRRSHPHPQAYALYQEATHAPSNLLTAANRETKRFSYPEAQIHSLGHYAKASLSHAIVSSLAIHANNSMAAIRATNTKIRLRTTQLQNLSTPNYAPITPIYSPAPAAQFASTTDGAPLLCELAA